MEPSMVGNIVDSSFKLLEWLGSGLGLGEGEEAKEQASKRQRMAHEMNLKRMEALTSKMGQGPFSTDMAQQKAQAAGAMTTQRQGPSQVAQTGGGPEMYDILKQAKHKAFGE
jgi:hypothetical protein